MSAERAGAPFLLVLAGHDPTGGAGVDADREAAAARGVDAHCVVTAWTDQDGRRVHAVRPRPVAEWVREARAWALAAGTGSGPGARLGALKTGLLPGAEAVHAAADLVAELAAARVRSGARVEGRGGEGAGSGAASSAGAGADAAAAQAGRLASQPALPVVVDPVLAASGGEPFLDEPGVEALRARLLALPEVVLTPNLPELARLAGLAEAKLERDTAARLEAAHTLLARGARAVVVKGGHGREDPVADLLLERGAEPRWLLHPRIAGASLHGSGCRFASSLAAGLALGCDLATAAGEAGRDLAERIEAAASRSAEDARPRRTGGHRPRE